MKPGDNLPIHNPRTLQALLASQETQAYAMAFLSFFALAFFTIFAIRPTLISFFNLQRQIEDAQGVDAQLESKIEQLLAAQQVYQDYQSELTLLDQALPKNPEFAQLIQKLEEIINDKEATMTAFETIEEVTLLDKQELLNLGIAPQSTELDAEVLEILDETPAQSVKFSLAIAPEYIKNEAIVKHLLDLKRIVGLNRLEFVKEGSSEESDGFTVSSSLEAEAFYLPEQND